MIEIIKLEEFPEPYYLGPGCYFILMVEGKEVHREEITECKYISHWAYIKLGQSSVGYLVGDESLVGDLTKLQEISNGHR